MTTRGATLPRRGVPSAAASGDRRFRRPDVRPAGRRQPLWWFRRAALGVAVAAIVCGAAYRGVKAALASSFMSVTQVLVSGNVRLSTGDVDALVQGIRGENILRVNLDAYRRKLMDSPWVSDADVRRVLPSTIEVRVVERTPMAIARIDRQLYLVDDAGVIIDDFGPEYRDFDLPIVDGLVATSAGGAPTLDEARIALADRFLSAVGTAPALRQRVSQVDVSDEHDVVVLLDDDPTLVHLGEGNFVDRLKTYQELAPTLQDRLHEVDYVDMRFDTRVYARSKAQTAASRKKK